MKKYEVYNAGGQLVETVEPPQIVNGYEYEVLACKKAIEAGLLECAEMPHSETILIMEQMDALRKSWGVVYPFEKQKEYDWKRENNISVLEVYDIETGERSVLAEFDGDIEAPNWSADGTYLTYNSNGHIYKYDLQSGNSSEVYSGYATNCNNDHVLAPDGSGIAVSHHIAEDWQSRIYIVPFEGGEPRLVTPLAPSYLHGWSPDGSTLAYCAERNGEYDIYTIPVNGGVEKRLTDAPGLNDGPEYDSEGEYIWFNSVRTGRMQAWRMKADGSEQTQMTFDEEWNTWFPHISPDRRQVVMLAYHQDDVEPGDHVPNKNVEIRLMPAEGGEVKTIIKLFGGQGTINVNSWAPDSKRFAFVSYRIKQ
jgi:Tol biopolymer transport system component